MKYALIGCGRISVNHIQAALNNNLEFVGVCDLLVERMKEKLVGKRLTVVRACPCPDFSGEISDIVFMGTTHKHSPIQLLVSVDQVNRKKTETLMIKDEDLIVK